MQLFSSEKIRNVALVGHGGSGKTSLAEALLHRAGAINRLGRVESGTTVCDHDPEEQRRGLSLSLAVAPFEWKGHKVNLIDTPGYADFMGDVAAALRVVDLAIFVVSAVDGVEVQTDVIWREAARLGVPRMVFINKLDRERASFERTLDELRERLGAGIAPLELPIGAEAAFHGIADLLTDTAHLYEAGVPRTGTIPEDMEALEHQVHDNLVEGIVVADDALLERYLDGEVPSVAELERALTLGIETAAVFPVVCGSATAEVGIDRLADLLVEIGPPPERPLHDRHRGRHRGRGARRRRAPTRWPSSSRRSPTPSWARSRCSRCCPGTVRNDDHLTNSRTGTDERLHGLFVSPGQGPRAGRRAGRGRHRRRRQAGRHRHRRHARRSRQARAGAAHRAAGGVLATGGGAPHPGRRRQAGHAPSTGCRTRTRALSWSGTRRRTRRSCGAPARPTSPSRSRGSSGSSVSASTTEDVRVRYRETITEPSRRPRARHKKQSGGHGQFAVVTVRLEPLERGEGFEFVDKIVGGAISRSYIPAVAKGVEEAMARGGVNGHPVVDVRVTLLDGKEHSVDSSEMAFRAAGRIAFREAMAKAGTGCARAGRTPRRDRPGRAAGRRPGRPERPPREGAGHRAGRPRRAGDLRHGPRERAAALRQRAALAHRRAGPVRGRARPLRRRPRPAGGSHPATTSRSRTDAMAPRPPSDAVVALRSLARRFRSLFAGLGEDESPDDLAQRNGVDGRSAVDHVAATTRTLSSSAGRSNRSSSMTIRCCTRRCWTPPGGTGPTSPARSTTPSTSWSERPSAWPTRVRHVGAKAWSREARVAGHDATVSALTVLWDAVDSAIGHLKSAQKTLAEVRGR